MLEKPLQLAPVVIVTRPEERGKKRVRCIRDLQRLW